MAGEPELSSPVQRNTRKVERERSDQILKERVIREKKCVRTEWKPQRRHRLQQPNETNTLVLCRLQERGPGELSTNERERERVRFSLLVVLLAHPTATAC